MIYAYEAVFVIRLVLVLLDSIVSVMKIDVGITGGFIGNFIEVLSLY